MSDNELIKSLQERIEYQIEKKLDIFIENQQLKKQISKLSSENTKLQNDLFTQQLNEDEADDYIDKLKKKNERLQKAHSNGWKEKDKVIKKINEKNNGLKNELFNVYLKQQHQERLISELKLALSSYNNFVDEMFPE